jgi:hypothetical protein
MSAVYNIGQVLFVVLNKKSQVYPMQIVEIIHKKTLRGDDTKYLLQGGSDKNAKIILDEIDGEIFDSAEKARTTLIARATQQVNNIVNLAIKKSSEWYGVQAEEKQIETIENLPDLNTLSASDPSTTEVMLPDGSIAKIKLPVAM